jgi:CHAT domain-containing protein/tetratricopeptide (TPR) repeat protein
MSADRIRLKWLIGISLVIAIAMAALVSWITEPSKTMVESSPSFSTTPEVNFTVQPLVVLPDRGEPRTLRLSHLEEVVQQFQNDPQRPVGEFAHVLLSLADVRIQLHRFAGAQEAVEIARQLVPDPASWPFREAEFLQQELREWEQADDKQRQIRRDRSNHHELALSLYAAGEYLKASRAARQAVALQRQLTASSSGSSSASERAKLADELLLLGRLALEHSDTYLEAEGILKEARELCLNVRGPKHPAYAGFLTALAEADDDRGNFEIANPLYEEALEVLRSTRGELNLDFARTLALQGRMHLDWWEEYAAGKGYRALQIRQQLLGEDHLECAESFEHLGMNALWLLNFDKAKELLERAYAIRKRDQGDHHPDTAEPRSWLSLVYMNKGDVAQAWLMLQDAIQTTEEHHGKQHPRLVPLFANVAHLGQWDWNQPRGEREGRRSLEIAEKMGTSHHPATFDVMAAMSNLMLEEESPYGIAQLRRYSPSVISAFLRKAVAAHEAWPRSQQLPSFAESFINLAHVGYWDDYVSVTPDEADAFLDRAFLNIQKYGADLHPRYAEYLFSLGRKHLWRGEEAEAMDCMKRSLNDIERHYGLVLSERRAGAWRSLSGTYMHAGVPSMEMDQCLKTTARLDEEIYRQNAAGQCDVDRYCMSRARFFAVGTCVLHAGVRFTDSERYQQVLSTKGQTAVLHSNERQLYERPELRNQVDTVRQVRRELKSVAYDMPRNPVVHPQWRENLFAIADQKEARERELAILARPFMPEAKNIDAEEVQASVPSDAVLLDFVNYTELGRPQSGRGRLARTRRVGVFVVRRDAPIQFLCLGSSDVIDRAVADWLESLRSDTLTNSPNDDRASEVARLLWDPLQSAIGDQRFVLIAPDGPVCFVPFAALPGRNEGTYLIEDITIGYIPSARQWLELLDREFQPQVDGLLAVGDVDYQGGIIRGRERMTLGMRAFNPTDAAWENLPATRAEAEQICELIESLTPAATTGKIRTRLLTGNEPTIETLQAALSERWRYFHFAGHGLFADLQTDWGNNDPVSSQAGAPQRLVSDEAIVFGRAPQLLSGLVLTTPKGSGHPSDVILTAEEVDGLDLRGTEMVVLSACETALGNTVGGEGVLGLQRAFLNAGARSTVTSLWKVNDAATSLLMERFYERLWKDRLPKWEALRQAQLDLLRKPQLLRERETLLVSRGLMTGKTVKTDGQSDELKKTDRQSHPSLWAAFVLYGDGR